MQHIKINILTPMLALCLAATTTSCNDWLDVQPKSQVEDTELFKNETGFKEALAGVYSSMVSDATYTKEMTYGAMDVLAGVWTNFPSSSSYPYSSLAEYDYTATRAESMIASIWSTNYSGIANVNNILKNIDSKKGVFYNNNYRIVKGEALALRAFLHFDLLRCFGVSYEVSQSQPSIPYSTDYTSKVFQQLTVKEVADKVIADLTEAESLLNGVDPIQTGEEITEMNDNGYLMNRQVHLNYYAVKALQARVYMWTHDYDKALAAANEVINSGAFKWATQNDMSSGLDLSGVNEQIFALNNISLSDVMLYCFNEDNNSTSFSLSNSALLDYFGNDTPDYRYLYLWKVGSTGDLADYRYYQKFAESSSTDNFYNNKMPLIRLGEMYLIAAECDYRNGGTGLDLINTLRQGHGGSALTSIDDFYSQLIQEYRCETMAEGQLFFLYKRLNRTTIPGRDIDMVATKSYTFPIPTSETEASERKDNR